MQTIDLLKKFARELISLMSGVNDRMKSLEEIGYPVSNEIRSSLAGVNRLLEYVSKVPGLATVDRLKHAISAMEKFSQQSAGFMRQFLTAQSTVDSLGDRVENLHYQAFNRHATDLRDNLKGYDTLRSNRAVSTSDLRSAYIATCKVIESAEVDSKAFVALDAAERVRETLAGEVVGSIKPARRNKAKARAKSAAHRKLVEDSNKVGKKKSA